MGKRKAIWIRDEQFDYFQSISDAELISPPAAMKKLLLILKRHGISDLVSLDARLKVIANDTSSRN
jgi:hypothetical protein